MTGLCVICRAYKQVGSCLCPPAFVAYSAVDLKKYVIRLDTPVLARNMGVPTLSMETVSFNNGLGLRGTSDKELGKTT